MESAGKNPRPWYLFVVVWMAVFCAGLVLCRSPITSHRVESRLQCSLPVRQAGDTLPQAAIRQATSPANVSRIVAAIEPSFPDRPKAEALERIGSSLEIRSKRTAEGFDVLVSFEGDDAAWCRAVVDQVGIQLAQWQPATTSSVDETSLARKRWSVQEASHYERSALFELESYLDHYLAGVQHGEVAAAPAESAPTAVEDERVVRARERIDAMTRTLDELLVGRTQEHPEVRALQAELELAGAGLRDLEGQQPVDDADPAVATQPSGKPDDRHQLLLANLRDTMQQRARVTDELLESQSTEAAATAHWTVSPSRVMGHRGGRPAAAVVIALGFVAALAAGGLVRFAWPLYATVTASSDPDDADAPLPAEASTEPELDPAFAKRHQLLRYSLIGCEALLITLAAGVLWSAVASSPWLPHFVQDPLGTFAESAARFHQGSFWSQ